MNDRSWMLNAKAIRAAKECINIVKDELGIKLTLSHEEFMEMLYEYVELTDSLPLADAYADLLALAGGAQDKAIAQKMRQKSHKGAKVVPLLEDKVEFRAGASRRVAVTAEDNEDEEEYVEFRGKEYARFSQGKEFKGLYRGQPRYA